MANQRGVILLVERLSNKLKAYLPHLPFIGFGVDRLYDSTLTGFGPGLPTLSGLHLMLAKLHTSFQTISDRPVVKRFNLSESLGALRRSTEDISHFMSVFYSFKHYAAFIFLAFFLPVFIFIPMDAESVLIPQQYFDGRDKGFIERLISIVMPFSFSLSPSEVIRDNGSNKNKQDISCLNSSPPKERGLEWWQLLIICYVVGHLFYILGRDSV